MSGRISPTSREYALCRAIYAVRCQSRTYVRGLLDMKISEGRLFTTKLQQERKNKKHETKTGSRKSNHQCNVLITTKNSTVVHTLYFLLFLSALAFAINFLRHSFMGSRIISKIHVSTIG